MWAYKSGPDRDAGIQSVIFDVGKAVTADLGRPSAGRARQRPPEGKGVNKCHSLAAVAALNLATADAAAAPVRSDVISAVMIEIFLCLPLAFIYKAFILERMPREWLISYSLCLTS